jgi:hypothetical protein
VPSLVVSAGIHVGALQSTVEILGTVKDVVAERTVEVHHKIEVLIREVRVEAEREVRERVTYPCFVLRIDDAIVVQVYKPDVADLSL